MGVGFVSPREVSSNACRYYEVTEAKWNEMANSELRGLLRPFLSPAIIHNAWEWKAAVQVCTNATHPQRHVLMLLISFQPVTFRPMSVVFASSVVSLFFLEWSCFRQQWSEACLPHSDTDRFAYAWLSM